jgi:plastocyanin
VVVPVKKNIVEEETMIMKKIKIATILGMLLAIIVLAGCTSSNYQAPTLTISQPQSGTTLQSSSVTVKVQVTNFDLVNKLGGSNVAGEGHIHYFLDYDAPTTPNQPATPPSGSNVKWTATPNTSYTFTNVSSGSHKVSVELVNNDHSPLNPPVVATVSFNVQGNVSQNPQITITQPTSGQSLPAGSITTKVSVSNFNLVDKLGQQSVSGEGHIHYFLDYQPPTTPNQPAVPPQGSNVSWAATANTSYTFMNVTAGSHTIYVELVNNNHTPLVPPVTAQVTFSVSSGGGGGQNNTTVIYLQAKDISFNVSTITVPAGANVIVHFSNEDSGIPHNFAVYESSSASKSIFVGKIITGVSSITYNFTAPITPGNYYFRCDVHPTIMTGTFTVT